MKFYDVFSELRVDGRLERAFDCVEVVKIKSFRSAPRMEVALMSEKIVRPTDQKRMELELKRQYFYDSGKEVQIVFTYALPATNQPEEMYKTCLPYLIEELSLSNHLDATLLENAKVSFPENRITLCLTESNVAKSRETDLLRFLKEKMQQYWNRECAFSIVYAPPEKKVEAGADVFDYEEFLQRARKEKEKKDLQKTEKERPAPPPETAERTKFRKRLPDDPDLFYGRPFEGELTPICEIQDEIGEVVVHGKVIKRDERDLRSEKKLLSFALTDFTDTINVKLFLRKEAYEKLCSVIKEGAFLRVRGMAQYDKFDHEVMLGSVSGIKKEKDFTIRRKDTAPVKRVELHCHTQMSDMDAVVNTKKLVNTAFSWGHPAIAITDHGVVQSFVDAAHALDKKKFADDPEKLQQLKDFKIIYGMEGYLVDDEVATNANGGPLDLENDKEEIRKLRSYHIILLCKNDIGRINLYRLASLSHLHYFSRRPKIPKSLLRKYREGLIVGSACEAGELFQAILHKKEGEDLQRILDFYDYYEIQPIGNNHFMIRDESLPDITSEQDLIELNKTVVRLAEEQNKLCVATCDVHFQDPEDEIYRRIIMAGKKFADADLQPPLYFRTTEEMLDEFRYLPKEKAMEIVVTNTNRICDMIEKIQPVRPDKCPPVIENSDQELTELCFQTARDWYGENLPIQVTSRLERELNSIIKNGFAVMYIIAQRLVKHSNEDGYLVGSRGSVGSSFVATMAGITEVNPLPAHYYCKHCHYYDFDSPEVAAYNQMSGFDMPDKACPNCGHMLIKDGQNIPFETFLGFYGDKEPDIDLNFSGEYQSKAHAYTEVLFGKGHTFRAGTIGTLADKTAYGFIKNYFEERGIHKRAAEIDRIVQGCVGVRRTTGQHPGGIVVLPHGEEIYSFTAVQHPANDNSSNIVTTHFDYHSIDHNLLKLDILGHDDPTMIRMLEDLTGLDAKGLPMDDAKVMSLFESTEALGVKPEDLDGCDLGCLGVPELGTEFVMQMLRDTKPKNFSDMIRISGLSHGTDVWLNNTQTLIEEKKCTLSTAICTRDDIMTYLIHMGVENGKAFKIMESVRKGRGLTPEMEADMLAQNVPDWYIWSCKKIKYMFPKAHACAYVMMALRIAYFKVYYPLAYYAAYFSIRAKAFSYELMALGKDVFWQHYNDFKRRNAAGKLSNKEQEQLKDMKIVMEMYARGLEFLPIDIYKVKSTRFQIIDGKLMPSLTSITGLGDTVAQQIEDGAQEGAFLSCEDFQKRCRVGRTTVDLLTDLGVLNDLPKTNQLDLSSFLSY